MRRIFIAAAAIAAASPAFAAPATPTQLEMETWRAFQAKRVGEIKSLFAPDFVGVYADGTHDLARELQSLNTVTIADYKIENVQSHALDGNNVMLTYDAHVRLVTAKKKTISSKIWMGSLWERRGGRWLCVYHTEIVAK